MQNNVKNSAIQIDQTRLDSSFNSPLYIQNEKLSKWIFIAK